MDLADYRKKLFTVASVLLMQLPVYFASAQDTLRIMPLGNSVTRGSMCTNGNIATCVENSDAEAIGYRYRLFNLMTSAGYNFDFVGVNNYGYGIFSDTENSGFDGIRSADLADVIQTGTSSFTGLVTSGPYLNSYPADIILLHIGTNDVLAHLTSVSNVSRILNAIDTWEIANGKPVLVFVARILSKNGYPCNTNPEITAFNNNLVSMVQSRINGGDHIVLVDMECNAGIDYFNDFVDQVHPNQAGYTKMGDLWFQSINNYNSAPLIDPVPEQVTFRGTPFTPLVLDNYVSDVETPAGGMTWTYSPDNPQHFSISIGANRQVTATPLDPQWSGSETVQFRVTDGGKVLPGLKKSAVTSVTFTVKWMPEITGQLPLATPEETSLSIDPEDLVIVEPEKAPAAIDIIINSGANYTFNGSTITPAQDFNGYLTVPVQLSCEGVVSDVYNMLVNVTPVNDPPAVTSQNTLVTDRGMPLNISLDDIQFTDPDNTPAQHTLNILSGNNYTVNNNTVVPAPGYYGELLVNATLSDLEDLVYFTLDVTVNFTNIPPVFTSDPVMEATENQLYSYVVTAEDIDVGDPGTGQSLTFMPVLLPGWLTLNPDGNILAGIPRNEDVGQNSVQIAVTDGTDTVFQDFTIEVINVNDPPFIAGQKKDLDGVVDSFAVVDISQLIIEDPDNLPDEMNVIILPGTGYEFDGDTIFFKKEFAGLLNVEMMVNDGNDDSNVFGLRVHVSFRDDIRMFPNELVSRIYPNPAHDYVIFEMKREGLYTLELRDITGRTMLLRKPAGQSSRLKIDITVLPKGTYIYRVSGKTGFQAGKLVIN